MAHVTVMTGPERRRRWSLDERHRIMAEAFAPGAVVLDVARRNEVSTSLLYKWRRQLSVEESGTGFLPAVVASGPAAGSASSAAIIVELPSGARLTIGPDAPAAAITAALRALGR
jgi:transposase